MAYTEPITKESFLEINYSVGYYNNKNERITNTKSINGEYKNFVDTLSNSFVFNRLTNTPGINYRVNKKKYNYSFASSVGFSNYVQKNMTEGTKRNYKYTNFFPQANINYKLKSNANLRFYYNGSTNAPSLEQLQPTRVNTDPLNIYIGNPNLKQSFRHNLSGGYNMFNVLKEKNIFSGISFSTTQNAFVNSSSIDSLGRRIYQTVNANGVYNMNLNANYGFKTTKSRIRLGFGPNFNINRNIDFVNGIKNISKTINYGFRFNFSKEVENKYNFYGGPYFAWNHATATVNKSANADYWTLTWWTTVNIFLPKKFELNTDVNVQARQKDPRFTKNSNYTTWNASLVKRMLKDNKLEISLSINDILDQNKGYQRNFNSYSFTETYYQTLRRFWLLTVTWNLSKNGKPAGF